MSQPLKAADLQRRLCAVIERLPHLARSCILAGRVLSVDRDSGAFVLADRSGRLLLASEDMPEPGAIIGAALEAGACKPPRVAWWRVLTPGQILTDGEYQRLSASRGERTTLCGRLRRRSRALAAVRAFFARRAYVEVQTPLRVRLPGLEPHLVAQPSGERYLITSPEYHMKRLLVGGMERIYSLGPCWRREERGRHHLGEFTMLEWYRAYSGVAELMCETEQLVRETAQQLRGTTRLRFGGQTIDVGGDFLRLSVADAFRRYASVELEGAVDAAELRRRAEAAGGGPWPDDVGYDAVFSEIMVERVEPALTELGPLFLFDYPAPLAALARIRSNGYADRFELYAGGLELANAFGELTDAKEQRSRFDVDRSEREALGVPEHASDERFLAALAEGMPPTAGIALGFDRLLMLLCDIEDINDCVAFAEGVI